MTNTVEGTAQSATPILVYDGDCGFCQRWVKRFKRWDRRDAVALLPLQDERALKLTGRSRAELEEAMHVVLPDGGVFSGAAAARELLEYVPVGWLPRLIFGFPGVMPLANRVYRWVAGRRYRLGCGGDHCRVARPETRD